MDGDVTDGAHGQHVSHGVSAGKERALTRQDLISGRMLVKEAKASAHALTRSFFPVRQTASLAAKRNFTNLIR